MADGLTFRDSDSPSNPVTIEFSADLTTPVSSWITVEECFDVAQGAEQADQIELTNFQSTTKEFRAGFGNPGTWSFQCNWVPKEGGTHGTMIGLWLNGDERYWRVTWPKVDPASADQATHEWRGNVSTANVQMPIADRGQFNFDVLVGAGFTFTEENVT